MKKAVELSVLCGCDVSLLIFHSDKMYEYSNKPFYENVKKYADFHGHYESLDNSDVIQLIIFALILTHFQIAS